MMTNPTSTTLACLRRHGARAFPHGEFLCDGIPTQLLQEALAAQKSIIGAETIDALYATTPADSMHFQRVLSANCFGNHVTRGGLDIPTRELIVFALIVSLGGADPQAKSHAGANITVGNTRADLIGVLTQILPYIGYPRTLNGLAAVNAAAPA